MTRQLVLWSWALAAALLVGCQALSLVTRRRLAGVRKLIDLASATDVGLVVSFLAWMWLGWHFFAR